MKLFAFILATFITVLVAQPTIQFIISSDTCEEVCSDSCCESNNSCSQNSNQSNSNNCCQGSICNPFQVCACCVGGNINSPAFQILIAQIKTKFNPVNQNNPVLGFNADCFHPPEIV